MPTDIFAELLKLFVAGAAGGAVAAWANWGVEKKRQKLTYRKELIAAWRKMASEVDQAYKSTYSVDTEDNRSYGEILISHPSFFSLKPHLSNETIEAIESDIREPDTVTIRTNFSSDNTGISEANSWTSILVDEIAQIEAEWDLV